MMLIKQDKLLDTVQRKIVWYLWWQFKRILRSSLEWKVCNMIKLRSILKRLWFSSILKRKNQSLLKLFQMFKERSYTFSSHLEDNRNWFCLTILLRIWTKSLEEKHTILSRRIPKIESLLLLPRTVMKLRPLEIE